MKYARFSPDNVVVEVFTPPTGFTLEECFHASLVEQFEGCPDNVDQNWVKNPDGTYTEPTPDPVIEPTNP